MLDNSTLETLRAMHCSGMAAELEMQLKDSKTYNTLAFEERIALMVDVEWNKRQQNKLQKLIKLATFSQPFRIINTVVKIGSRIFQSCLFNKAVQLFVIS